MENWLRDRFPYGWQDTNKLSLEFIQVTRLKVLYLRLSELPIEENDTEKGKNISFAVFFFSLLKGSRVSVSWTIWSDQTQGREGGGLNNVWYHTYQLKKLFERGTERNERKKQVAKSQIYAQYH